MAMAFEGLRVVDLSDRLSGAWAARLFAGFGAEVLLVEDGDGHALRREAPFLAGEAGADRSLMHGYVNAGKHSIKASGADALAIAQSADVVISNRADIELPDGVVHLVITPHGATGPWAEYPGDNITASARTGWATINKHAEESPLQLPVRQTGYIAGVAGFIAAAAALQRGGGDRVDVSELEAVALTCMPWAIMGIFIGGESVAYGPTGLTERGRPGPLWRAQNGLINYGYGDWAQWTNALNFLGEEDLATDERYVSPWGRHQQDARPVRDALARGSATRDKWELFHGLAKVRCISGVVQNAKELHDSEQLNARGFIVATEIDGEPAKTAGAPAKLSATPWRDLAPAPALDTTEPAKRPPNTAPRGAARQPLDGVRVLCFTQAWAGTFCTEILALLGADVVQIETVKRPDVWRGAGAPVPPAVRNADIEQAGINTNGMYNSVNLNKRAITLDVTDPKGREMFWSMIPQFDVMVDNFSPHVMTNWGVTLESLHAVRPDMIFASVSGYGRQGPLAEYPANGATTEPMAGFSSIHGYEFDEPMNTGGLIPDPISGYYLAASILAAINHRRVTGEGQRIDAAMIEAVAVQIGDAILEYSANDNIRQPGGNRHPTIAPHNIYAADGEWIAIAASTDDAFDALTDVLALDWGNDPRFQSVEDRKINEPPLDERIAQAVATQEAGALAERLCQAGVAAAKVEPFKATYAEPNAQFEAREFLATVSHPQSGTHRIPVMPWRFEASPPPTIRHAPLFGEHSEEVFREELGIDADGYQALVAAGLTGTERVG